MRSKKIQISNEDSEIISALESVGYARILDENAVLHKKASLNIALEGTPARKNCFFNLLVVS